MNNEFLKNNSEVPPRPVIKNISDDDIESVLSLQAKKIIVPEIEIEKKLLEENGFLIYPVLVDEIKDLIENGKDYLIKVAKEEGKVVGYLISYDMKDWEVTHPGWLSRLDTSEENKALLKNESVLYGKHIAVDEKTNTAGVGKELLDATLKEAVSHNYKYFIVEVLKEPIENNRSLKFVQKAGFNLIGQTEDENKRVWSVLLKDLSK